MELQERLANLADQILSSGLVNLSPGALTEFDLVIHGDTPDQSIHVRLSITMGQVPYKVVRGEGPFDVDITFDYSPLR
jgi:uncharacterized protein with GYD domain